MCLLIVHRLISFHHLFPFNDLDGCQGMWLGQKPLYLISLSLTDSKTNTLRDLIIPLSGSELACLAQHHVYTQTQLGKQVGRTRPCKPACANTAPGDPAHDRGTGKQAPE